MGGSDGTPTPEPPTPLYTKLLKFLCGHVGLFLLVAGIAGAGACAFIYLESPAEDQRFALKRSKAQDMEDGTNYFVAYWWHYAGTPNLTEAEWYKKVKGHLKITEQFTIDAVDQYNYDGTVTGWVKDWTPSKALLFTITIMTTIGYGHIFPMTWQGQMFTIVYAMIATPLMLVFLANIGDSMAKSLIYTYSRLCCRWCRATRYKSETPVGKKSRRLWQDEVGKEPYMPTSEVQVPVTIILLLIAFYLMVGAVIFSRWEEWELSSAYYFSFVTLSTIGFGDMVPGNSFLDRNDNSMVSSLKMATTILYCVIGMALISMCIQVMQEQVLAKVRWAAKECGLVSDADKRPRAVVRRTKRGAAPETAYEDAAGTRPETTAEQRRRRKRKEKKANNPYAPPAPAAKPDTEPPPPPTAADGGKIPPVEKPPANDMVDFSDEDLFNLA